MTKRFTGEFDKQYSGVHDNGEQLTNFEVVDLLNNLSEDNEYLEKRFKEEEWHYDHIDEDRDVWKYKLIWDSIGSDIDVAIHNETTNKTMWIIENGKPQLMAIQKVVKLLNKGDVE